MTHNNPELKTSKVIAGREFDPHCRCSRKEDVEMKYLPGVEKIQKERIAKVILTGNSRISRNNE